MAHSQHLIAVVAIPPHSLFVLVVVVFEYGERDVRDKVDAIVNVSSVEVYLALSIIQNYTMDGPCLF